MTRDERQDFIGYLRACTDHQLYGVLEKERAAKRTDEIDLTKAEMERRGIDVR